MKITLEQETRLIQDILHGKPNAARKFYNLYHRPVKYFVASKAQCREDAEEIVQDIFLSAIESLALYSGKGILISWLYGIARHEISDYYRKKRVKILLISHVPILEEILGYDEDWIAKYDQISLQERIRHILALLLPRYRHILELKYLEGWSVNDIATELSESFKATETALFRARKAFVLEWNRHYQE